MAFHMQTSQTQKYWDLRHEVTLDNDLLLNESRIIIPSALRESFLHDLHEKHAAITKCQLMARSLIYWPSIIYRRLHKAVPYMHQVAIYSTSKASDKPLTSPLSLAKDQSRFYGLGKQKLPTCQRLFISNVQS